MVLTTLMWGGNTVAGRLAVGEMSPMVITCLRWLITCLVLSLFAGRAALAEWPAVRRHWLFFIVMALCGFTIFNAVFYYSAHLTSGINLSIIQSAIPVFVLIGTVLWRHLPVTPMQMVGLVFSLIGILVIATKGDIGAMAALSVNVGDLMMLIACIFSAIYTLAISDRPKTSMISFFVFISVAAFLTSIPMLAVEYASGAAMMPTPKGWLILLYISIFPSMLGQIFFIRGVELMGAGRVGIFLNLTPVLGSLLAVLLLHERFGLHHALSLVLVLGGIFIAERRRL
ncbi:MAG: DMT family transporter [Beijerinckiaceae bacterium]|nr:DMT family transporter [Beijerinckiaceae bacterium]